jgi:hypothetical protein
MKENIRYYTLTFSVKELINQIENGQIILNEDKYRNLVWGRKKQSLFIDSIYRDFPIPPLYLYENRENSFIVIDGLQRLRTLFSFYNNGFSIASIDSEIIGFYFKDLTIEDKNRFLRGRVNITIIEDTWNSTELIETLFYRLNAGGESLTNQEFRNRMYFGKMINCVNQLNANELWREIYNGPMERRYKDSEFILRFFTLINDYFENRRYPLQERMNNFIEKNRNNEDIANHFSRIFLNTLNVLSDTLGRKALLVNGRFNSTLFDALFIPIGIKLSQGEHFDVNFAYEELIKLLQDRKIQTKSPFIKVRLGVNLMEGVKYD